MTRPIRIHYPGALYHVMARGRHGQEGFTRGQSNANKFFVDLAAAAANMCVLILV
jgi:hypothetical protein